MYGPTSLSVHSGQRNTADVLIQVRMPSSLHTEPLMQDGLIVTEMRENGV